MALKQRHKTRWKGGKQHKVGLNTDRDMACSLKRETNVFEIQTKDIRTFALRLFLGPVYMEVRDLR